MSNLLLLLFFIACLSMGAMWLAENPGTVTIHWFEYQIDTSFVVLLVMSCVAAVGLSICYLILRTILHIPARFSNRRSLKQYRAALTEITYSVAALAASDTATAQAHTRKAEKLLGTTPLTLLLSAQIARNQGDEKKTHALLEQLLDHKETEYLAARNLSEAAGKQDLLPKALQLAERAQTINPRERESLLSVIGIHVRLCKWQEALQALKTGKASVNRAEQRELRGKILLAQAQKLAAEEQDEAALVHARAALSCLPEFVPALCFTAECYAREGEQAKALKLLQKAWRTNPHPQLADGLRALAMKESPQVQKKILATLHDATPLAAPLWNCSKCSNATSQWALHCPSCQGFNTLS